MSKKTFLVAYKILFALLGFSAIVTEVATLAERGRFDPYNFFSFFTIESNVFVAVVFLLSALATAASRKSKSVDMLRGASVLYITTVLIVFDVLLSNLDAVLTAVPWDNTVLHYIVPFAMIGDWLIDPPKKRIAFKSGLVWLAFPIIYVIYSLVRGAITGWYPYPFLNPATHGYGGVVVVSAGITALVLALTLLLTRLPLKKS